MRSATKTLFAGVMSAIIVAGSYMPASAMPIAVQKAPEISKVEQVQYRRVYRDRRGYYQGQRGYRHHRPGYRRHRDGYWYPLAAFGAGALIGGAIASQHRSSGSNRHIEWCMDRYRSYRASDNTYVPRAGVRAECVSPYS